MWRDTALRIDFGAADNGRLDWPARATTFSQKVRLLGCRRGREALAELALASVETFANSLGVGGQRLRAAGTTAAAKVAFVLPHQVAPHSRVDAYRR